MRTSSMVQKSDNGNDADDVGLRTHASPIDDVSRAATTTMRY